MGGPHGRRRMWRVCCLWQFSRRELIFTARTNGVKDSGNGMAVAPPRRTRLGPTCEPSSRRMAARHWRVVRRDTYWRRGVVSQGRTVWAS